MRALLSLFLPLLLLVIAGLADAQPQQQPQPADEAGEGTRLERFLERQIPGLSVRGLSGSLTGRIGAERLTFSDDQGVWLVLENAQLSLAPTSLLRGVLRVESLAAEHVIVRRLPEGEAPPPGTPAGDAPQSNLIPQLPNLPVDLILESFAVERLELEEPVLGAPASFAAEGQARLAEGVLAGRVQARRLDGEGLLNLALNLEPRADRLDAEVTLREPAGGILARALGLPGDRPAVLDLSLSGPASGAQLSLEAALGEGLAATAQGTVSAAAGGAVTADLTGTLTASALLPPEAAAVTPLEWSLDAALSANRELTLRRLRLAADAGEAVVTGQADLATERVDLRAELTARESERLAGLIPGVAGWDTLRAEARIEGPLAAPTVSLDAAAEGFTSEQTALAEALGPNPQLSLRADLPERLDNLHLQGAALQAFAEGRIQAPLDLRVAVESNQLSAIAPVLAGAAQAEARITGTPEDPTITLTAAGENVAIAGEPLVSPRLTARIVTPFSSPSARATLEASYAGLPISLRVDGEPQGDLLRLREAEARFGPARLTASGTLNPATGLFEGTVQLAAPQLKPFEAVLGTQISGQVQLTAQLEPTAEGLQAIEAKLITPGLTVAGVPVEGALTASGTPQDLRLALDASVAEVALAVTGQLEDLPEGWRLRLARLRAAYRGETVQLANPPAVVRVLPSGAVVVESFALTLEEGGRLRIAGRWGPEQADLRVTLEEIPASALADLGLTGPDAPPVQGTVSGEIRVTGPISAPQVRAEFTARNLESPVIRELPPADIRIQASATGTSQAELEFTARAGEALRLQGTARLPEGFGAQAPLRATAEGNAELSALLAPFLAARGDRATGRVTLALQAGGTLGNPELEGRAVLQGGSYRSPAQGVVLTDISGLVTAQGDRLVVERLTAQTPNGGQIALTGTVNPLEEGVPVDLALVARNARPVQSDQYSALLDANLTLTGEALDALRLAGRVQVDRAEVRVPEELPRSVRTLLNLRERGEAPAAGPAQPEEEATEPPRVALDVVVDVPSRVFVRGRGLDAEFGGRLLVTGTIEEPQIQGQLELRRGTFTVLDRRLTFDRGIIAFESGTLTPTLDFLASTQVGEVTAQVLVQGTPSEPKVTFTSTPELPQDEILARLLFGRELRELSPFQIAQLAQAAAGAVGLNVPTGGGILDRLRRALALDRLTVGAEQPRRGVREPDIGGATVEAGRYVAEGVYIGVLQGSEGGSPRVSVEIELLPRLKAQAQTGSGRTGDSVGLSYEFEY